MIKRFAGRALVIAMACVAGQAFAADAAPAATVAPGAEATVQLADDHPTTYIVKQGDTLWGISEMFLKNAWEWPSVWHINEQVANPHRIYPGDKLTLVWKDGRPSLVREEAYRTENAIVEVVDANTLKMRPRIRESEIGSAIPAIPLRSIEAFLVDNRVVSLEEMQKAPYVIAGPDRRVIMGNGDTVYARSTTPTWVDSFPEVGVFRQGGAYVDPVTREILGYEAKKVGTGRVLEAEKSVATMRLLTAEEDVRINDRLLQNEQRAVQSTFFPHQPPEGMSAQIIHIFGTIGYAGRNDVLVINKGSREKVEVGHVFALLQSGEKVRDRVTGEGVQLPARRAGLAIIFRTFDKISYALVTRSSAAIRVGDSLGQPRIDLD